jgi:hypothetical protein
MNTSSTPQNALNIQERVNEATVIAEALRQSNFYLGYLNGATHQLHEMMGCDNKVLKDMNIELRYNLLHLRASVDSLDMLIKPARQKMEELLHTENGQLHLHPTDCIPSDWLEFKALPHEPGVNASWIVLRRLPASEDDRAYSVNSRVYWFPEVREFEYGHNHLFSSLTEAVQAYKTAALLATTYGEGYAARH